MEAKSVSAFRDHRGTGMEEDLDLGRIRKNKYICPALVLMM